MTKREQVPPPARWALGIMVGALVAIGIAMVPGQASADHVCAAPVVGLDTDGDGFSDVAECNGFTTLGTGANARSYPRCAPGIARTDCVDPDSKDVFVIYKPLATNSLLGNLPSPFADVPVSCLRANGTSWCGGASEILFTGLRTLGLTVHQVTAAQVATDRKVTGADSSLQKAIRLSESSDVRVLDILGNCQWGKPTGLDGCVVYTHRARTFIDTKCNQANDTTTNRTDVLKAYLTYLMLHESGHTLGGLTARYDAAFGGYHYSPVSSVVMSQSAQVTVQPGACTWYIPSVWNLNLDPLGVAIKP